MGSRRFLNWLAPRTGNSGPPSEPEEAEEATSSPIDHPKANHRTGKPPKLVTELPARREVVTGTATIVIYDLEALAHRLNDEIDWWADPEAEIDELRNRNLLILGVQADGFYDIDVMEGQPAHHQTFSLRSPSGMVFIGPGESMTGGGAQPNGHEDGFIISLERGDYTVSIRRIDDDRISIAFKGGAPFENDAPEPVRI